MANIKSAIKRAKQNIKRRLQNNSERSKYRTYIKGFLIALKSENKDDAKQAFLTAQKMIDKSISKGIIHKNKGSRLKSRLHTKLKSMS